MPHLPARIAVDLSPRALLAAGVRGVLAVDVGAASARTWTLRARARDGASSVRASDGYEEGDLPFDERRGPVAVVRIHGPTDQRATEHLCGVTDGYDAIEARFRAALSDVEARAVVIEIDSPGGDAAGLIPAVRRMRAAADRAGKPVFGVADEWATSAACALLMVADRGRVHVPLVGRTASIGTVMIVTNEGPALAQAGIEVEVIRSGERKMRPSGVEPIDDDTRDDLQALVDARAADFAAWVAERRGLDVADVLALKGASLSGEAARAAGLIDGTANAHEVIEMAVTQAALDSIAGALGLSAGASAEQIQTRAEEARAALDALPGLKAKAAEAEGRLLALSEAQTREKAQIEAQAKRAAFVSEVKAACSAGLLSPTAETALIGEGGHFDAHGEASARATFTMLKSSTPIVPAARAVGGMITPSAAVPTLTPAQIEHAKAIGMSPEAYAAGLNPTVKEP